MNNCPCEICAGCRCVPTLAPGQEFCPAAGLRCQCSRRVPLNEMVRFSKEIGMEAEYVRVPANTVSDQITALELELIMWRSAVIAWHSGKNGREEPRGLDDLGLSMYYDGKDFHDARASKQS